MKTKKQIKYFKMSGTGNDFIVFDNRSQLLSENEKHFFSSICQRRFSIGADGIILLENGSKTPIRMRYYNSDGVEAALCGNGVRCAGFLAKELGFVNKNDFQLEAADGLHDIQLNGTQVCVSLLPPTGCKTGLNIIQEPGFTEGAFLVVGVSHYVIFVPELEQVDVETIAPYYRHHSVFPNGTNINFVQMLGKSEIRVRTFEKGVEKETLSCGTGCVASALIVSRIHGIESPVPVHTRGGLLSVNFDLSWNDVTLTGEVAYVYNGVLNMPDDET